MPADLIDALDSAARGHPCAVQRYENGWSIGIGTEEFGIGIFVEAPWRIVSGGRIAHAATDDGHKFGLPDVVDGEARANELLKGQAVRSLIVDRVTADLRIEFDDGVRLDVFANSAGYESWNASFQLGAEDVTLIAGGGGELSFVSVPRGTQPKVVFGQPIERWRPV